MDIFTDGDKAGHKQDTLYAAKARLGVVHEKRGGRVAWFFPEVPKPTEGPEVPEGPEAH